MSCCCYLLELATLYAAIIYPIHQTYKQVKDEGQNLKLWSYFWVFYAAFQLLDYLSWGCLDCIPLFGFVKTGFFVWLYHSKFQGSLFLGDKLKPHFQLLAERTKPITEKFQSFTN